MKGTIISKIWYLWVKVKICEPPRATTIQDLWVKHIQPSPPAYDCHWRSPWQTNPPGSNMTWAAPFGGFWMSQTYQQIPSKWWANAGISHLLILLPNAKHFSIAKNSRAAPRAFPTRNHRPGLTGLGLPPGTEDLARLHTNVFPYDDLT